MEAEAEDGAPRVDDADEGGLGVAVEARHGAREDPGVPLPHRLLAAGLEVEAGLANGRLRRGWPGRLEPPAPPGH